MKYIVRLNMKAFNPLTKHVIASKLWEVEQCEAIGGTVAGVPTRDSERVLWHCAEVRIDGKSITQLFQLPKDGKPWETSCYGVCTRGQDDAVEIRSGAENASGH